MFFSYLNSKMDDDFVFSLIFGLVFGLVVGLGGGLGAGLGGGLVFGLVFGLVVGLAFGLVVGLVVGLVFGLGGGLGAGLGAGLANYGELGIPLVALILGVVVLTEVLFFVDRNKPSKRQSVFWFTARRKLEAFVESSLVVFNLFVYKKQLGLVDWSSAGSFALGAAKVVGIIVFVGVVVTGYLWLNSLKYGRKE